MSLSDSIGLREVYRNSRFVQFSDEEACAAESSSSLMSEEADQERPLEKSSFMKCWECFSRVFCCKRRRPLSSCHSRASILPISNADILSEGVNRSSPSSLCCCSEILRSFFRKRRYQRFAPLFRVTLSKQSERMEFLLALEKLVSEEKIIQKERKETRNLKKLGDSEAVKLFQEQGYSESLLAEATSSNKNLHLLSFFDQTFNLNPEDEKARQLVDSFDKLRLILIQKQEEIIAGGELMLFAKEEIKLRAQEFDDRWREYEDLYLQRCIQNRRVEQLIPLFQKGDLDQKGRVEFLDSLEWFADENGVARFESESDLSGILRNLGEINGAIEVSERKYPEIVWRKALAITQGLDEIVAFSSNAGKRWLLADNLCRSLDLVRDSLKQKERRVFHEIFSCGGNNDEIFLQIEELDRNWMLFERALTASWSDVLTYTSVHESGAPGSHTEFILLMREAVYICLKEKFFKLEDLEYCCNPSITFVLPRLAMKVGFQYGLIGIGDKTMLPIITENFTELKRLENLQKQIQKLNKEEDLFLEKKLAVISVDESSLCPEVRMRVYSIYRQLCSLGDEIQFVPGSKHYNENEEDVDSNGNRTNSWYSRFLQEVLDIECLQQLAKFQESA